MLFKRAKILAGLAAPLTLLACGGGGMDLGSILSPPVTTPQPGPFPNPTPTPTPSVAISTVAYGGLVRQEGDWRMPQGDGPFPAILLIHGGCWVDAQADRKIMNQMADAFAAEGIASYNADYRALGVSGAGWPGTWQDWANAAAKFDALSREYPIDRSRLAVLGHSAGATGAWFAAARPYLPRQAGVGDLAPVRFSHVVELDGPPDVALVSEGVGRACGTRTFTGFFGGTPASPPDYLKDIGVEDIRTEGTKHIYVEASFMAGVDNGRTVPLMREAGNEVELLRDPRVAHLRMLVPGNPNFDFWFPTVVAALKG